MGDYNPKEDFEITPEMIEAGIRFLYLNRGGWLPDQVDRAEFVRGLYEAMRRSAQSTAHRNHA